MADEIKIDTHAAVSPETDMEYGKVALNKDELHLASLGYKQGEPALIPPSKCMSNQNTQSSIESMWIYNCYHRTVLS